MKKYELAEVVLGLYRVRALIDIPLHSVVAGDVGGFVAGEHNLAQEGLCWVSDNAVVSGNARVRGNAVVRDDAVVRGDAWVSDNAVVQDNEQSQTKTEIYRAWINQPSTAQPLHRMNGRYCIAVDDGGPDMTLYFTEGDTHSITALRQCVSKVST